VLPQLEAVLGAAQPNQMIAVDTVVTVKGDFDRPDVADEAFWRHRRASSPRAAARPLSGCGA
jgi:hypothetical protein